MVTVPAAASASTRMPSCGSSREQRGVGDGREAQPVAGIRGIGDQLAQEDLPVAVQGVDHELQQLTHLGLKAVRLPLRCRRRAGRGSVSAGLEGSSGVADAMELSKRA